jgi:hypothetical protein
VATPYPQQNTIDDRIFRFQETVAIFRQQKTGLDSKLAVLENPELELKSEI